MGKFIPQLPQAARRGGGHLSCRTDAVALTLAARYSDRSFGTIDNSDPNSHTFQGFFDGYRGRADAQVFQCQHYRIDDNWSASVGVDNLNNDKYFLYHPFPLRTFVMELHYAQ